jgi:hypothetical protein
VLILVAYDLHDAILQSANRLGLGTGRDWVRDHLLDQAKRHEYDPIGKAIKAAIDAETPDTHHSRVTAWYLTVMIGIFGICASEVAAKQISAHPHQSHPAHHQRAHWHPKRSSNAAQNSQPRAAPSTPSSSLPANSGQTPTYAGLCGTESSPGDGAPGAERLKLYDLWLGTGAPGGIQAACADPSQQVPHQQVWYATAFCQSALRSIGVSPIGRPATLVIGQQPAQFILDLADSGQLLNVQAREAGDGEIILVDTPEGTWALIQNHRVSPGASTAPVNATSCSQVPQDAVTFAEIPPAGLDLLVRYASVGWRWPIPAAGTRPGMYLLRFGTGDAYEEQDGTLKCDGSSCALYSNDGRFIAEGSPRHIDLQSLSTIAPPPAAAPNATTG